MMTGTGASDARTGPLAAIASGLRRDLAVERVSVAEFGRDGTFSIVAEAGQPLLPPGRRLAVDASTHAAETAAGRIYRTDDLAADLTGGREVDRLMLELTYRSGCSLPLGDLTCPVGALSISSAEHDFITDGRFEAASAASTILGDLLVGSGENSTTRIAIYSPDEILARGVRSVVEEHTQLDVQIAGDLSDLCTAASAGRIDLLLADVSPESIPLDHLRLALHLTGSEPVMVLLEDAAVRSAATVGTELRWARRHGVPALLDMIDHLTGAPDAPAQAPTERGPMDASARCPALTPREGQILAGMSAGHGTRRIARDLGLTESTVKSYGRTLFRKLNAHSRGEAVAIARAMGPTDRLGRPLSRRSDGPRGPEPGGSCPTPSPPRPEETDP